MSKRQTSKMMNLHKIFDNRNIVEAYHRSAPPLSTHFLSQKSVLPEEMAELKKNQKDEISQFVEDQMLEQYAIPVIVQQYGMLDEREEDGPYIDMCPGEKPLFERNRLMVDQRINMLDSSSQNNDIPSRNSSLSSVNSRNGIQGLRFEGSQFIQELAYSSKLEKQILSTGKKSEGDHSMDSSDLVNPSGFRLNNYNHLEQTIYAHGMQIEEPVHMRKNQSLSEYDCNTPKKKDNKKIQFFPESSYAPNTGAPIGYRLRENERTNNHYNPSKTEKALQKNTVHTHAHTAWRNKERAPVRRDIDSSRQKLERIEKIKKIQEIGCNCKKSKCLKMYCQCFNLQIFCSQNCNCCGCGNLEPNHDHQKAVLEALTRNPKAFSEDSQKIQVVFDLGLQLAEVKKGCKCRKTKCLKKYCECYNSNQACGKFCQCEGCENCGVEH